MSRILTLFLVIAAGVLVCVAAWVCFAASHPKPTPAVGIWNGDIVLLKRGSTNAVFIVTKQNASPESVEYTWFLRSDGKPGFDVKDPRCSTGVVRGARNITVGPFDIQWSIAEVSPSKTTGWLYYPNPYRMVKMPWGKYWAFKTLDSPLMAVTTEHAITNVDVNDPRWKFQR